MNFGWNEFAVMNTGFPLILGLLFAYVNISDETMKNKLTKYQTIIILFIILAIIGLIFTSLYVQWNDESDITIIGVQGRYFIPIVPLCTLLICNKLKFKTEHTEEELTKITGIGICITSMYTLVILMILNI